MKYGHRLKESRSHAGLTQAGLADAISNACSQENISKLERCNATGSEYTMLFAKACGVNPFWLATGEGEMLSGSKEAPAPTSAYSVAKVDFDFISRVNELPGDCRKTLEVVLTNQERLLASLKKQNAAIPSTGDMPMTLSKHKNIASVEPTNRVIPKEKKHTNKR